MWTNEDGVFNLVAEDKWAKTKAQVAELQAMLDADDERLDRKRLEQIRGFLIHIGQAYRGINTYLNGLHLTIDGWRPDRDERGWRRRNYMTPEPQEPGEEGVSEAPFHGPSAGPKTVRAMPRLKRDVGALLKLVEPELPPLRRVRSTRTARVLYGFGDASGPGFGSCMQAAGTDPLEYEFGQWPCSVAGEMSSNWRELNNFVELLERLGREGRLDGWELLFFTDNFVTDGAHSEGYSTSELLDALILRLYILELTYNFILHLIHVSGLRMIQVGGDGLSRGDRGPGAMRGFPLIDFIPLHLNAFQRFGKLRAWLMDVLSGVGKVTTLTPEGWFTTAHNYGTFVWAPPPAAADVVVEQLSMARHKRSQGMHIIVVPRLMTGYWRKHLGRATDMYFKLTNEEVWPLKVMFEPVLIFVCLPLISHRPNFPAREKLLAQLKRLLLGPQLPEAHQPWFRDHLRELFAAARELCPL